jgi:hypothetical protein
MSPRSATGLRLPLVQAVIDECERRDDPALAKVLALLWRFAAEAVRAESRDAFASAPHGRLPRNLDFCPANDDDSAKPTPGRDFETLRLGPAQLELSAVVADPIDDQAPRIELPQAFIAALDAA